jgi:L-malate glycosyltransferase
MVTGFQLDELGVRVRPESRRVAILQRYVPQYRVPFFDQLRLDLLSRGVNLDLIYGHPSPEELLKGDTSEVPWGISIRNRTLRMGQTQLVWQPCLRRVRNVDLVIVEQASRMLINYLLLFGQSLGGPKVALWGSGIGFRGARHSRVGEALKRRISKFPHWWFAYNELSAESVATLGYPLQRITTVQNAIDTSTLEELRDSITPDDLLRVRISLGILSNNIGVYLGSIYKEKRPRFLLESLRIIRSHVPDFEAIVVGAGPDQDIFSQASANEPWIHYVGPTFAAEKVAMMKLAKVMLMPGRVGLAIIDSFVIRTPLVTIAGAYHAPEIAYLKPGSNGEILPAATDARQYAHAVIRLLHDESQLEHLKDGCKRAASYYTLGGMVTRFSAGIMKALGAIN